MIKKAGFNQISNFICKDTFRKLKEVFLPEIVMQFHQIINRRHLSNETFRVWRLKLQIIPKLRAIANMQRSNSLIL